jgi:succinyl-CoA synthetase beta subunit
MRNFPNTINNKQDITNLMAEYPVETKAYLQIVLDTKDQWLMTSKLATGDVGITDATHKVEELTDESDVVSERYQYEFMEDPNGELYRLGYSNAAEVESILN